MIDTHCHLDLLAERTGKSFEQILAQCAAVGVTGIIIPGLEPAQWQMLADLCDRFDNLYFAVGLHPWWIDKQASLDDLELAMEQFSNHPKCIAIGECGLDGLIETPAPLQQQVLNVHLRVAQNTNKPIILHSRKSHHKLFALLKKIKPQAGGILHGFSGNTATAQQFIQQGLHLGIGGTITYLRAKQTRTTVTELEISHLILETDSPDMPLQGFQGHANNPAQLPRVAQCLAKLRGESAEHVTKQTSVNAHKLFRF